MSDRPNKYEVREQLEDHSKEEGPGHILCTGYTVYDPVIGGTVCVCKYKHHAVHIAKCCNCWLGDFNHKMQAIAKETADD